MHGHEVLKKIEDVGDEDGKPTVTIIVCNSGEFSESGKPYLIYIKYMPCLREFLSLFMLYLLFFASFFQANVQTDSGCLNGFCFSVDRRAKKCVL